MSARTFIPGLLAILVAGAIAGTIILKPRSTSSPEITSHIQVEPDYSRMPIPPLPRESNLDPTLVVLGRRLFEDRQLSSDNSRSCASCHDVALGGDDGLVVSLGVEGRVGTINTPTVLNSTFNFRQFWDGRVGSLEEQAEVPLTAPNEMNSNFADIIRKLEADPQYVASFRALFPDAITKANIVSAIATYERSLVTPNSKFDQFLRKEASLSAAEARGYAAFDDLGCITCHQGVSIGGNIYQTMGKLEDFFAGRPTTQADLGRYNVTKKERDRHKFKVPTLRNIALTAPYFHDGSAATLGEAIQVMARYQLGYRLDPQEIADLVAFLNTLTGTLPTEVQDP